MMGSKSLSGLGSMFARKIRTMKACYLQLTVNMVPAQVKNMNSLSRERFHPPFYTGDVAHGLGSKSKGVCRDDEIHEKLNMAEKEHTKDMLMDAAGRRVDKYLNDAMMVDGRDDGLDAYFQYEDKTQGFRIVEVNTIQKCHGYSF